MSSSHALKRRRYEGKDAELLKQVSTQTVTEGTLREKLAQHVEQVRNFLENLVHQLVSFAMQQGFPSYPGWNNSLLGTEYHLKSSELAP